MNTLIVTSPIVSGPNVKAAQTLLAKSKYGSFYHGLIDGQFGPLSGAAAKAAKYALGFPEGQLEPSYGDVLNGYLSGKVALPLLFKARKASRAKKAPAPYFPEKALSIAKAQIGVKESPQGSNNVLFGRWYGANGQPWCAQFVSWCYSGAGSKAFVKGKRWAYCPYILHDALAGNFGLSVTKEPQAGDVVLYSWKKDGVPEHVGLFEQWLDAKNSSFSAIEGNTSVGNDSNGGEVMRRSRDRGFVVAFIRVSQ